MDYVGVFIEFRCCCGLPLSLFGVWGSKLVFFLAEWRCYQCIKARVKSIGENFGFHDAQQEYNLVTFAEFANSWKRDYFQKKILVSFLSSFQI